MVLSGECADEIFGGYPWFYKKELYSLDSFPWIRDIDQRLELLNENIKKLMKLKKSLDNPYFGRVDFESDGFSEPIYIGINGIGCLGCLLQLF